MHRLHILHKFYLQTRVCTDTDHSTGHRRHSVSWWHRIHTLRSALTQLVSRNPSHMCHMCGRGSGVDRDTDPSLGHKRRTETRLENRNTWSSPAGRRHSGRRIHSYSPHIVVRPRWLYTDRCPSRLHIDRRSLHRQRCTRNGCRHQVGPCGCGGWAGILEHSAHTWAPWCDACSPHTHRR